MQDMSKNPEFVDFVLEQMAGDVQARAMFGGHGIYHGETMFAIIADGELYFKADELTREEFIARGLQPFTYEARGKSVSLQYYAAPSEVFDEQEIMIRWAKRAIAAALRANRDGKPAKKRRRISRG